MKKLIVVATLSLCMFLSTVVSAQILNGSFEDSATYPEITGGFKTISAGGIDIDLWSVAANSVDYIGDFWQASLGERSVDLNGTAHDSNGNVDLNGPATGTISQTLTTVTNRTYTLTFDMSGNPDNGPVEKTLTVSAAGQSQDYSYDISVTGNSRGDMKWATKTFTFKATGTSTVLTFASTTSGPWGPALDNVAISSVTAEICHRNNGNKGPKTLVVGVSAIPAHLAHGDSEGPCVVQ